MGVLFYFTAQLGKASGNIDNTFVSV